MSGSIGFEASEARLLYVPDSTDNPGGWVCMQHNHPSPEEVKSLLEQNDSLELRERIQHQVQHCSLDLEASYGRLLKHSRWDPDSGMPIEIAQEAIGLVREHHAKIRAQLLALPAKL